MEPGASEHPGGPGVGFDWDLTEFWRLQEKVLDEEVEQPEDGRRLPRDM